MQTVAVRLPGDVVGMDALWAERHAYDVMALVPSRVAPIRFLDDALDSLLAERCRLAGLVEEAMLKDRLRTVGRARAEERLLHLFLELNARQSLLVEGLGPRAWVPFSQMEVANATGMTNVYVSKTMTQLRERRVVAVEGDVVTLRDPETIAIDVDFVDHLARAAHAQRDPAG